MRTSTRIAASSSTTSALRPRFTVRDANDYDPVGDGSDRHGPDLRRRSSASSGRRWRARSHGSTSPPPSPTSLDDDGRRAVAPPAPVLAARLLRARRRASCRRPARRPRTPSSRRARWPRATRRPRSPRPCRVWGAAGVEPLLHEWRGALFRVRLARLRLTPPGRSRRSRRRRGLRRPGAAVARVPARALRRTRVRRRRRDRHLAGLDRRDARRRRVGASSTGRRRRASRASDFSLPSSSRLSNSPGEIFEPVIASRIGWNAVRGFSPSSSASARSSSSRRVASHGSTGSQALVARAWQIRGSAPSGADVLEEEADEVRVLRELLDLLLHERHGRVHALSAASRCRARRATCRASGRTRPAAGCAGRRRSASRASCSRTSPGSARRGRGRSARPARDAT